MLENIIKVNNKGGKPCNKKLQQAVNDLRAEMNVEHECNINNIKCNDLYQSHMKKKDVSTINEQLSMKISSPLNTFQSKAFVIGLQDESVGDNRKIICMSRDSRNSMGNHSRIGTPGMKKIFF